MTTLLAFAMCAAAGAILRAEVGRRWNAPGGMPWGTLAVNVSSSFLLGLVQDVAPTLVTVVGVGGLGALTTFSSFAGDSVALLELRRLPRAVAYVTGTVVLGVAAAAAGSALG